MAGNKYAIKAQFGTTKMTAYGLFVMVFDGPTERVERFTLVAGYKSEYFKGSVKTSWKEFESRVISLKLAKANANNLAGEIQQKITERLSHESIGDICRLIEKSGNLKVKTVLKKIMLDVSNDRDITFVFDTEIIRAEDLIEEKTSDFSSDNNNDDDDDDDDDYEEEEDREVILLKVEPIIAPVGGIKVSKLSVGDMFVIRIIVSDLVSKQTATSLGLYQGGKSKEISAPVEKIELGDDSRYIIQVKITDDVHGIFSASPNLMVKRTFSISGESSGGEKGDPFQVSSNFMMVIMIASLIFVIFIIGVIIANLM